MARYRPVDVRVWSDRKFSSLSDQGRLLWLFLLTAPATTAIPGVVIGGEAALAEQMNWSAERLRERFRELADRQLQVRVEGRVVWLPNALRYQPPCNPNMVKGWAKQWDDIPECGLKLEIWEALKIACKGWSALFEKRFAKPLSVCLANGSDVGSANGSGNGYQHDQDQDQEHDQEQDLDPPKPPKGGRVRRRRPEVDATQDELAAVRLLLDKLGDWNGIKYEGSKAHTRLIVNQLRAGRTVLDLRKVVGYCADPSGMGKADDEKQRKYLRPETLFGPETIERYLDAARAWAAKHYPEAA